MKFSFLYRDDIEVTLHYEPKILNFNSSDNNREYGKTKVKGDGRGRYPYYHPDIVLEIKKGYNTSLIILDAKYSSKDNVKKHSLEECIMKYVHGIHNKDGTNVVESMILIYPENENHKESEYSSYYHDDYSIESDKTIFPIIGIHSLGFNKKSSHELGINLQKIIERIASKKII